MTPSTWKSRLCLWKAVYPSTNEQDNVQMKCVHGWSYTAAADIRSAKWINWGNIHSPIHKKVFSQGKHAIWSVIFTVVYIHTELSCFHKILKSDMFYESEILWNIISIVYYWKLRFQCALFTERHCLENITENSMFTYQHHCWFNRHKTLYIVHWRIGRSYLPQDTKFLWNVITESSKHTIYWKTV